MTTNMETRSEKRSVWIQSRMYISVFLSAILILIEGTTAAWTSPLLKKLRQLDDNPLGRVLTDSEASWIASIGVIGTLTGAFGSAALSRIIGRKPLLNLLCLPSLISFSMLAFCKEYWLFLIAKIIGGVSFGGVVTVIPMYFCEVADPKVRGTIGASLSIFMNLGTLFTYCVGPAVSFQWYHIIVAIIPVAFVIFFSLFGLESPYFILQSDPRKAEDVLRQLRGREDVIEELNEMKRGLSVTSNATIMDVFSNKGTRRAFFIFFGLTTFTMFTGSIVILTYMGQIFDEAGGTWTTDTESIITGFVQLMVTCFVSFTRIPDKFERRTLLPLSYVGVALALATFGCYFELKNNGTDISNFRWLPLVCLTWYFIVFNIGVGPLSQTVPGEIFPLHVKSVSIAFCSVYGAILAFLWTLYFGDLRQALGIGKCFWLFSAFSLLAAIFIRVYMVETRGRTLEQIQDELNGRKPEYES